MKNIQHVFFDLDHTLWDYDRNAQETLTEIHSDFELEKFVNLEKFIQTFYSINDELWHKYNSGLIEREEIKQSRFSSLFQSFGIDDKDHLKVSDYFIESCSTKPHLMPDALNTLNYLQGRYQLHIITNGFNDTQPKKLKSS
ncbi:MAG: HAD family hydrolase, partial [Bacteroidota bacterium]